mmetsp:Transcript_45060/g.104380  ORF Transcript_45060/g.104380 Transcript_45060/m.104380 type:complete len:410 (-) Transcript_45060:163-1392(-)
MDGQEVPGRVARSFQLRQQPVEQDAVDSGEVEGNAVADEERDELGPPAEDSQGGEGNEDGHALIDQLMEDNKAFREQLAAMQAEMDAQEKAREADLERRRKEIAEVRERKEARDKRVREEGLIVPYRPEPAESEADGSRRRVIWPPRRNADGAPPVRNAGVAGVTATPIASTKGWSGLRQVQARSVATHTAHVGAAGGLPAAGSQGQVPQIAVIAKGRQGDKVRYIVQVPHGFKGALPHGALLRQRGMQPTLSNGNGQFMLPYPSGGASSAVPVNALMKTTRVNGGMQYSYVPLPGTSQMYMSGVGSQQASLRAPVGGTAAGYPQLAQSMSGSSGFQLPPGTFLAPGGQQVPGMSVRRPSTQMVGPCPSMPQPPTPSATPVAVPTPSGSILASALFPTSMMAPGRSPSS